MKLILLLISFLSCLSKDLETYEYLTPITYNYSQKEYTILSDINAYRNSLGLQSLELHDYVSNQCLEHTNHMVSINQLTHNGFETRAQEIKRQTNTTKIGECISYNFDNPVNAWIRSDSHRAVLETSTYTKIGISFREGYCTIILIK